MTLMGMESVGTPGMWLGFLGLVIALLALDLGVFHRKAHAVSLKEAAFWSVVWVALAGLFGLGVYYWFGTQRGLEFVTGYLIEKALAVDNIFVIVVIFSTFRTPPQYQHRVLFWGILGALVMRMALILVGGALLERFHWMIFVFGAILIGTGAKLLAQRNEEPHPEDNILLKLFSKLIPSTNEYDGSKFITVRNSRRYATPLFTALAAVEITDLIFAVDSIPAIFAVTRDPFIVFTSNIFAILGLRSLYFLLADIVTRFIYLKVGLSFILIFVGVKMMLIEIIKIPIVASLAVIAAILIVSIAASLLRKPESR